MTFLQIGTMIWVSRLIKFYALTTATLLASCLSDESSRVDIQSVVGSWSGETDDVSLCIDMTEDQQYRHVQFKKREKELKFQSGRFELQRGKRLFLTLTVWGEDGYGDWEVDDDAKVKHRDVFVVTDVTDQKMTVNMLHANPDFTIGAESIRQRVESCAPAVEKFKSMLGAVPS